MGGGCQQISVIAIIVFAVDSNPLSFNMHEYHAFINPYSSVIEY